MMNGSDDAFLIPLKSVIATAIACVVIVAAVAIVIANTAEYFAASGAFYIVEVNSVVHAYRFAAVGTLNLHAVIVAAVAVAVIVTAVAVTIFVIVTAVAAVAIVVARVAVVFILESAEIFVNLFDILLEIFGLIIKIGNRSGKIGEKVEHGGEDLIVLIGFESGNKTFYISYFFGKCHSKYSFEIIFIICNYFVFTLSRYSPVLVSIRSISPFSMKSGTWMVAPVSRVAGFLAP